MHFLANFLVVVLRLVILHILHLNLTDRFGGESLALDPNNSLEILSKPFLILSHQVPYARKRIAPANVVYHQFFQ